MSELARIIERRNLESLVIEFKDKVKALGTTVLGGGLNYLTHVVFKTVCKDFNDSDPSNYARRIVKLLNLPTDTTAVFLTAVDVLNNKVVKLSNDPVTSLVICTAGLENPSCIYGLRKSSQTLSTINVLVVVDCRFSEEGLVDLFRTVTEAKALATIDLGLSCGPYRATGTVSDAIVVSHILRDSGNEVRYAGMATNIGNTIAKLVYQAVCEASYRDLSLEREFKILTGLNLSEIVDIALKAYLKSSIPGIGLDHVKNLIEHELSSVIQDPNVWCFIQCAKCLDALGSVGRIRGLTPQEYVNDSTRIVADEILGIALALYINGWKALFSYYWIERLKAYRALSKIKNLPMFMDDIISSIIGSILSKIYDKLLGN